MSTSVSCWRSNSGDDNTQIDLLIERADRTINICEIKFSVEPYVVTKEYENRLLTRNAIFKAETKTNKALNITFITVNGILHNIHSAIIQNEITAEDLFG